MFAGSFIILGVIAIMLLSSALSSGLMPLITFAIEPPLPTTCSELPDDGRPQPSKGANKDPDTWKVVPMRDDPSLFKVVDNAGINVADLFDNKANAEQYVAHFQCDKPISDNQSPQQPPQQPRQAEICNDGIDNDQDNIIDETILCINGPEICNDGIDNDQDGSVDEDCPQLPTESGPNLPDFGAGNPPELPERPICPFPNTIEAIEAGCIMDTSDKPNNAIYCTRGVICQGTSGPDFIQGTVFGDTIVSRAGNDRIDAKGGSDLIRSGPGDDIVYSDAGDDVIDSYDGNDYVYGGYGADVINGGRGLDRLWGEEGDDRIYHGLYMNYPEINVPPTAPDGSLDNIYCGPGNDKVWKEKDYGQDVKESGEPYEEEIYGCEVINE